MFGKWTLVIVVVLAMFCPGNVEATLNWDIYGDAVVSNGEAYNVVSVYDTPPEHTMVNVLGGYIDAMRFYDTSIGNIAGGNISSLGALGYSTVNISGVVEIGSAGANDFGTVNVSAGSLHSAGASGKALLNVSDAANIWMVSFFGGGTMNMVGGEIARVQVFDSSIVNLRGGIIKEGISTRAGDFEGSINVCTGMVWPRQTLGASTEWVRFTASIRMGQSLSSIWAEASIPT